MLYFENWMVYPKIYMEIKIKPAQTIFKQKNKSRRCTQLDFKTLYKTTDIETVQEYGIGKRIGIDLME